jgi:hypothetical protein
MSRIINASCRWARRVSNSVIWWYRLIDITNLPHRRSELKADGICLPITVTASARAICGLVESGFPFRNKSGLIG